MSPPRTSREWVAHFNANANAVRPIPWQRGAELSKWEKVVIAGSLPAWQLGETSDGRHLRAAAERYARRISDAEFAAAVERFIREEQCHGAMMGQFLDLAGIPRVRRNWGDSIFRALRYALPNLETWTTVVIMTETLALVYYAAVRAATRSTVLRAICRQMLQDEVEHLRFQYERLAAIHRDRSPWLLRFTYSVHRVLYAGTCLAVWIDHRRVLEAGGHTFTSYWRVAWRKMNLHWQRMRPNPPAGNLTHVSARRSLTPPRAIGRADRASAAT